MSTPTNEIDSWNVLIVDDEPDNVGVVQLVLKHFGAQVHTARNGEEGLRVLAEVTPTFILLDLSMPQMDGWAMISQVRSNPRTAHLPVIALTAHAMDGDKEQVAAAGFDGYISKPFRIDTLLKDIQGCLNRVTRNPLESVSG